MWDGLYLLNQCVWDGLREAGEGVDEGGALPVVHPDRQQGHAGSLALEGQVHTAGGPPWTRPSRTRPHRTHSQGLQIGPPLPPTPQQVVRSHCVHLKINIGLIFHSFEIIDKKYFRFIN